MSEEESKPQAERLADDLLKGAAAIGEFIGETASSVYYIHKTKKLPIGKFGKTLIASRAKLKRAHQALTRETLKPSDSDAA